MERTLYEGRTYYLIFPTDDPSTIKDALIAAGLETSVTWNRRNVIATLRVVNQIGLIRLFGKEFDIRSEKFLEGESGQRQFQILLDDLAALSRHIIFSSSAAPGANRVHSPELSQASLLERFNFYRQTCLRKNSSPGISDLVSQIIRNPHDRLVEEHVHDQIWNAKKPSRKTLKSLFRHDQSFARLHTSHSLAKGRPGLKIVGTDAILFPLKALRARGAVTIDTPENRFIKHVLLDIENVCRSSLNEGSLSGSLLNECVELLGLSRSLLRLPFFRGISRLTAIPFSSPALNARHGYRDFYRIFMQSRIGAKHLFSDMVESALIIELKDVSLLYEYWVFYKICAALLKPGAMLLSRSAIVKDSRIVNAATVSDGEWSVHFNKTYTRKSGGSYSLRFRPDIVIEKVDTTATTSLLHVLDAKYKNQQYTVEDNSSSKIISIVKPADIDKMHCYSDAIEGVETATAIYPGEEFIFYPRDRDASPATKPSQIPVLRGVGAVPLMPGSLNAAFDEFIERLRSSPV